MKHSSTRCRPGDLAVVITAKYKSNVGKIVTVVRPYRGNKKLSGDGFEWLIRSSTRIIWGDGTRTWRRLRGPALDTQLQPIRGPSRPTRRRAERVLEAA